MYIEDIIEFSVRRVIQEIKFHDLQILKNIRDQYLNFKNLTEKQGNLAIFILKKYQSILSTHLNQNIEPFLLNPVFKNSFRLINQSKTIRIISHDQLKYAIEVKFPYEESIIKLIQQKKSELNVAVWSNDSKSWIFSLDEASICFLRDLTNNYSFNVDEEFQNYIDQLILIEKNIENIVPMAVLKDQKVKLINVSEHMPQNISDDFLESIFFAKKHGVLVWDQLIEEEIKALPYSDFTKSFIKQDSGIMFELDLGKNSLKELTPILNYINPILVILGANNSLAKLDNMVKFFNDCGINNEEMTVMFRLPSDTDSDFNLYIKNSQLNSKLSKNIKVVFVGDQIPKTVLSSDILFESVLNYNYYAVHYRTRNFLNGCKNVINILDKTKQKIFDFKY